MKDNNDICFLNSLLEENEMQTPIDLEVQKYIYKNRKKRNIRLIKELGLYSFLSMIAVSFYFLVKKIFITVSWKVFAVILVSNAAVGICYYHYYVQTHEPKPAVIAVQSAVTTKVETPKIADATPKAVLPAIIYKMKFQGISSTSADSEMRIGVESKLTAALKGKSKYVCAGQQQLNYMPDYLMTGNLIKTGGFYVLYVKVLDNKKMSVVYLNKQQFKETDDLEKIYNGIADDIFKKISF